MVASHTESVRSTAIALAICAALTLTLSSAAPASAAFGILNFGAAGSPNGPLNSPVDVAVDDAGNVYVAEAGNWTDPDNNRVQKFSSAGAFLGSWGSLDRFNGPVAIAVAGGQVYVVDAINRFVQRFSSDGTFLGQFGATGSGWGQIADPGGIAIDQGGSLYLADHTNNKIIKFSTATGAVQAEFGRAGSADGEFNRPTDVAVDGSGNIYVADGGNHRVQKLDARGAFVAKWGSHGTGDGQFGYSTDITVDAAGTMYVIDGYNDRVQMFSSVGVFLGKFGETGQCEGQFILPGGVATDAGGRVYIADGSANRVQVFGEGGAPIPRCPVAAPRPGAGTPPAPPTPPARPTAPVTRVTPVAPAVSALSLSRGTFCIGRACPQGRRGTVVRFALPAAAGIEFMVERRLSGRRADDGRCGRGSGHNRGGRRCSYYKKAGNFSKRGVAGANSVAFSGRIGGRALRPGRYQLSLTAIAASGARSAVTRIGFRVFQPNLARPRSGR